MRKNDSSNNMQMNGAYMVKANLTRLAGIFYCIANTVSLIVFFAVVQLHLYFASSKVLIASMYFTTNILILVTGVLLSIAGKVHGDKASIVEGIFIAVCGGLLMCTSDPTYPIFFSSTNDIIISSAVSIVAYACVIAGGCISLSGRPRNKAIRLAGVFLICAGVLYIVARLSVLSWITGSFFLPFLLLASGYLFPVIVWLIAVSAGVMFILPSKDT